MARIIDLTSHSGVYATRLLAECGHDVIRVEPRAGDALRRLGPFLGDRVDLEHGAYHRYLNAGKRSFTLEATLPAGRLILLDLVRTADALVGNTPLPIPEDELLAANPKLVVTRVEGTDAPGILDYARSGLLIITGHPGQRPALMGGHVYYAATGAFAGVATAAALYVAASTGMGQVVNVPVETCLESLVEQAMVTYVRTHQTTERRGYRGAVAAISGAFPTTDGYWMVSLGSTADVWGRLMDWVDDPVLKEDTSLFDEAERAAKKDFVLDRLESWSSQYPKETMVIESQRRHIPASPVSTPLDLSHDPQLIARGFLREVDDPEFGPILWPVGALGSLRGSEIGPAPTLGQHTSVLLEELGYSIDQQQTLMATGVI